MRHVFVSYARADESVAHKVAAALSDVLMPVFIDSGIPVGSEWEVELSSALNNSFAVLVLWSPSAVESRWVRMEARYAVERQAYCPAMIQLCELPFGFRQIECARIEDFAFDGRRGSEWSLLLKELTRLKGQPERAVVGEEAYLLYELGRKYRDGDGVPQHDGMAFSWFQRALAAGHPQAVQAILDLRSAGPSRL